MSKAEHTRFLKEQAKNLGFLACAVSPSEFLEEEAPRLEKWLKRTMQAQMAYMANHFDKRLDPRLLVPGSRSVVSLLYNYYTEPKQPLGAPKVSRYAYGEDYHFVVKDKLRELLNRLREYIGDIEGRCFVDSAPVLERAWASKSGLGWVGKNANLIRKGEGSYFFLAELIIDLELEHDGPATDHCGTCTACIDACPTDAIVKPYVVDGGRCISYFTIELKDNIPEEFKGQFEDWVFGCDICQEVCPWNRFASPHEESRFQAKQAIEEWTAKQWQELTEDVFRDAYRKSPLKRSGFKGLKRNLDFLAPQAT